MFPIKSVLFFFVFAFCKWNSILTRLETLQWEYYDNSLYKANNHSIWIAIYILPSWALSYLGEGACDSPAIVSEFCLGNVYFSGATAVAFIVFSKGCATSESKTNKQTAPHRLSV